MKKEKQYSVPKFHGDRIILEAYATTAAAKSMTKLCELDVTGTIGQKAYNSNEVIMGGGNLFTILHNLHALNPDCEIKVSVKIV